MVITVTLPNTPVSSVHSPNSRVHWTTRARAGKIAKQQAAVATQQVMGDLGIERFVSPVTVDCYRYYSGRARECDEDNLAGTMKPFIDGIKLAIGVDDSPEHMTMRRYQKRVTGFTQLEFIITGEVG